MVRVCEKRFPKGYYLGQQADGFSLDGILKKNLDFIKDKVLNKKIDYVICCDGKTGIGKTTLSLQIASYLDKDFNLDKVCFSPAQFLEALKKAKKGDAIVFDEALIIGSRFAMSEINKKIMVIMSQIRSKQLFIFFILPSLFDLDRNLSLYRVNLLLHCYSTEFGNRGFYSYYFDDSIKSLYLNGKKFYSYSYPKPNGFGKFSKCFCLDENDYEKKKQAAIQQIGIGTKTRRETRIKAERDRLIKYLRENEKKKCTEISKITKTIQSDEISKICRGER